MIEPTHSTTTAGSQRRLIGVGLAAGVALLLALGAVVTMAASPSPSPSTAPDTTTKPGSGPGWLGGTGFGGRGHGPMAAPGIRGAVGFGDITITAIKGSSISLKTADGWTRTITVGGSTTITKDGKTIAVGDLAVGDQIRFSQTRDSSGTYTITAIEVVVPQEAGTVTATSANGFTIRTRDGTSVTVSVTGNTTYTLDDERGGSTSATQADVKVGVDVVVSGTPGGGNTFAATSVRIEPAEVAGQVTAKTGDSITVSGPGGTSATIHVTSATTYNVAGKSGASLADVSTGMFVQASGTKRADGSLDATTVTAANDGGHGFRGRPWGSKDSASPMPTTGQS